jgi:hypothetical protein
MPDIKRTLVLLSGCLVAGLGARAPAAAQTFPPVKNWVPLLCGRLVMSDRFRDQSGALNERDIVGDMTAPAGFRAVDDSFLYLRMRLDRDPAPDNKPRPFAWGMELSTDGDPTNYEILLMVNGSSSNVEVYKNSATTLSNDPSDPADRPPVASYSFSSHGQSTRVAVSAFGNTEDRFLDLAVPWSDLQPLGLTPTTSVHLWAGTSSTPNALDGDIACHDGTGGTPADLSGTAGDRTVLDPARDSDGDGYPDAVEVRAGTNPNDPNSYPSEGGTALPGTEGVEIEGGGGCSMIRRTGAPADRPGSAWLWGCLTVLALGFRRTRRHA